jgi:hypothetical protein
VWDFAHQVHSRVSNVNFVLCGGTPEIFPVWLDVDSLCCICFYSNIFVIGRLKVHFTIIIFWGFCDISPFRSLS